MITCHSLKQTDSLPPRSSPFNEESKEVVNISLKKT